MSFNFVIQFNIPDDLVSRPMSFQLCHVQCQNSMTINEFKSTFVKQWFTDSFKLYYHNADDFAGSFIRFTISAYTSRANLCAKARVFLESMLSEHDNSYIPTYELLQHKLDHGDMHIYDTQSYFDLHRPCRYILNEDDVPVISFQRFIQMFSKSCTTKSVRELTQQKYMSSINYLSFSEDIDQFIRSHEVFKVSKWFTTEYKEDAKSTHTSLYSPFYSTDKKLPEDYKSIRGGILYGDDVSNKLVSLLTHHRHGLELTVVFVDNCFRHDIYHELYFWKDDIQFMMDTSDEKDIDQSKSIIVINARMYKKSQRLQSIVKSIHWTRMIISTNKIDNVLPSSHIRWYIYDWFTLQDVNRVFRGFKLDDIWTLPMANTCRLYFGVPIIRFLCFRHISQQRLMVPKLLYKHEETDTLFYKLVLSRSFNFIAENTRLLHKVIDILCKHSCGIHDLNCNEFDEYEHLYKLQELSAKFIDNRKYTKFPMYNEMKLASSLDWCDEKTLQNLQSTTCHTCLENQPDMIINDVCRHPICLTCARISYIRSMKCSTCRQPLSSTYYRLHDNQTDKQNQRLHINADYAKHIAEQCIHIIHGKSILFTHYPELIDTYRNIIEGTYETKILTIPESLVNKKLSNYKHDVLDAPIILTTYKNAPIFAKSAMFQKVIVLDVNMKVSQLDTIANGFINATKYFVCKSHSYVASILFNRRHFTYSNKVVTKERDHTSIRIPKSQILKSLNLYKEYIKEYGLQED